MSGRYTALCVVVGLLWAGLAAAAGAESSAPASHRIMLAQAPQAPQGEAIAADEDEDEDHETTELLGSEALFEAVHDLGTLGGIGLTVALILGLAIRWAKLPAPRRRRLSAVHIGLALPFGILAVSHGTVLFFHEIFEGDWGFEGALGPGSWACALTAVMVVSGLGLRYNQRRGRMWRKWHRIALWPWVATVLWHVIVELL